MHRLKQKGFTLIELMVVISIISLLSSIILASLSLARQKANDAKVSENISQVSTAINEYYLDNSNYPPANDMNMGLDVSGTMLFAELQAGKYMLNADDDVFMYVHKCDATTVCSGAGANNNATLLQPCGISPSPANAVVYFQFQGGPSPKYPQGFGMNMICYR